MRSDYFPVHSHSEFSCLDGMGTVEDMVAKVARMGQPALSLTDHGSMAGAIRLYKECKKAGLAPFPGSEFYVVTDATDKQSREDRYHMGMLALNFEGYKGMVRLSSRSHTRERFHRKPLIDFDDLATFSDTYGEHVAVTTGCYFGLVVQTLIRYGDDAADKMIQLLQSWFPNLFVELQHHGIPAGHNEADEQDIMDWLLDAASRHGLPVLLGQDSHYCDREDQPTHDLMKDICYFGDGEDNRFPGGPYHLATVKELRRPWAKTEWAKIEEGHGHLLDMHGLVMPALEKYKFHVPSVAKNPDKVLRNKCAEYIRNMASHWQPGQISDYEERVAYELNVITKMGMSDYFLLVQEVTDWCRDNDVIVNSRGSVNGSLVAFMLGITTVDPIQWGTSFDRFLSLSRQKPPDIDLDVESRGRALLIAHLRKKFPTMVHIGTYTRLGITEQEDGGGILEDKGSVFVQYMAAMRRKKGAAFNGKVDPQHRGALNALSDMAVRKSLGTHAAGLVLPTDTHRIEDYLATGLVASSNTIVTQSVMEDVEDAGFVKLDVLGLRALETLNGALVNIGQKPNDWDWMPWNDKKACALLSSMQTDGIFQFEGFSTRKGGKEMRVRNTMDAIICLALYRPALMAGGQKDMYLDNRGKKKSQRPYNLHPFFDPILDVTAGVPVFQEQVMELCFALGMDDDTWNSLMKAVKASNDKIGQYAMGIMAKTKPIFLDLCKQQGLSTDDGDAAWEAIVGFTDYGFNRAHATSYGIMSYRSAYLKAYHPLEYMQALLDTWVGTDKEKVYMAEARRLGITIARPDVSFSSVSWVIDRKRKTPTLRKGLQTIKGIGGAAAQAIIDNRPPGGWTGMDHFVQTMPARPVSGGKEWAKSGSLNGVMGTLRDAGALASLGVA